MLNHKIHWQVESLWQVNIASNLQPNILILVFLNVNLAAAIIFDQQYAMLCYAMLLYCSEHVQIQTESRQMLSKYMYIK